MKKTKAREIIKKFLKNKDFSKQNKKINDFLFSFFELKNLNILAFYPTKTEPDIKNFLYNSKNNFFIPKIINYDKKIIKYGHLNTKLVKNKFNIYEPKTTVNIENLKINFALIPCLGYNEKGFRLGHGQGFFDKFFLNKKIFKIGICFDFQKIDFKQDPWDIKFELIITDKGVCYGNKRSFLSKINSYSRSK